MAIQPALIQSTINDFRIGWSFCYPQGAFIVLLTDGANNGGLVSPSEAALLTKQRGIPVFAISTGRHGWVKVPYTDSDGTKVYRDERSDLDEVTLWRLGVQTRGGFFRARDTDAITRAFFAIDRTQKIEFEPRSYLLTEELFPWLAAPGLGLLVVAALWGRPIWLQAGEKASKSMETLHAYSLCRAAPDPVDRESSCRPSCTVQSHSCRCRGLERHPRPRLPHII